MSKNFLLSFRARFSLGFEDSTSYLIDFFPSKDKTIPLKKIVSTINDADSLICTTNEREFMKNMGGGCNYPIGAYSNIVDNKMFLQGIVLSLDGKKSIRYEVESLNRKENLALKLSRKFFDNNVTSLLNQIDNEIK